MATYNINEAIVHNFGNVDSATYTITYGGTTIYTGKAVRAPGAKRCYARLNDILRPYVYNTFDDPSNALALARYTTFSPTHQYVTFTLTTGSSSTTYQIYNMTYNTKSDALGYSCFPVGKLMAGSAFAFTYNPTANTTTGASSVVAYLYYKSGTRLTCTLGYLGSTPYNCWVDLGQYADYFGEPIVKVALPISVDGNLEIPVDNERCYEGVLYYVNGAGGFDQCAIARLNEADTISRESYVSGYDTIYDAAALRKVAKVTQTRRWECTTGLLTDADFANLPHLYGTPLAYLWTPSEGFTKVMVENTTGTGAAGNRGKYNTASFSITECRDYER